MIEKKYDEDNNIVDFFSGSERSLANPAPVSRFDESIARTPAAVGAGDAGRHEDRTAKAAKLFDFTVYPPTAQERQLIQVSLFSVGLAVVIIALAFTIANGVLSRF